MTERRRFRVVDYGIEKPFRAMVVVLDGVEGYYGRWTDACSGCHEVGDYGGRAHDYGYDAKAQCEIGLGCHECGYTGKRRHSFWMPFPEPWTRDNACGEKP